MNASAQLLAAAGVAAATSFLVVTFAPAEDSAPSPGGVSDEEHRALEQEVSSLRETVADLTRRLEERSIGEASRSAAAPVMDAEVVDAALRRYLETSPDMAAKLADVPGDMLHEEVAAAAVPFEAKFEQLRNPGLSWEDRQEIWSGLSKEESDRMLKQFEGLVAQDPQNPDLQNELGEAYTHRLMNEDFMGMMKFGQLAEKQFDRALELNDHHWSARFNKAMSLSNQPAFLGKQPEAISHFETLISQQESAPMEDKHAATYLFLGNLYAQSGDQAKAQQTWQRGLGRFPDSKELAGRLKQ